MYRSDGPPSTQIQDYPGATIICVKWHGMAWKWHGFLLYCIVSCRVFMLYCVVLCCAQRFALRPLQVSKWFYCYCSHWRIRPGEEIVRTHEQKGASQESNATAKRATAISEYAHAVIFVVKANDPRLTDGKYKDTLQKIREHFREDGNNNIHQNSSFLS